MDGGESLFQQFLKGLSFEPTPCQQGMLRSMASLLASDGSDILVINGYAGTGKTTAIASVISSLRRMKIRTVLLAPTGRAAKVLSGAASAPAYTIHKHIYRQKSVGTDGFGQFSLTPNKANGAVFIVDEVSLIGSDAVQQPSSTLFGSGNLLGDLVDFVRSGQNCKLVLIGDCAQLPPVGLPVSPALDSGFMDRFGAVSYCHLTTVVRQAAESGILSNATALRQVISSASGPDEEVGALKLCTAGFDDIERIRGGELIECISSAYERYGEDQTVILCRSNKRAIRYNLGIRSTVQFKEEKLVRGDKLMIVKNCYQFIEDIKGLEYIANGDIARLVRINRYEERYGLHFAEALLSFPDYDDQEIKAKVCLDTLESESASLTYEQSNALYQGVNGDYAHIRGKKKRYDAVREDPYFNALQLKYANAITCHKSQGGQWDCVFIDCPFWMDSQTVDDVKWLYTALTRAVRKVYLVNFPDRFFV